MWPALTLEIHDTETENEARTNIILSKRPLCGRMIFPKIERVHADFLSTLLNHLFFLSPSFSFIIVCLNQIQQPKTFLWKFCEAKTNKEKKKKLYIIWWDEYYYAKSREFYIDIQVDVHLIYKVALDITFIWVDKFEVD